MKFNIESTPPTQAEIDAEKALMLNAEKEVERRGHKVQKIGSWLMFIITVIVILYWQSKLITGEVAIYGLTGLMALILTVMFFSEAVKDDFFNALVNVIFITLIVFGVLALIGTTVQYFNFPSGHIKKSSIHFIGLILYLLPLLLFYRIGKRIKDWITSVEYYTLDTDWIKPLDLEIDSNKYVNIKNWKSKDEDINKYFTNLGRKPLYGEYDAAKQWVKSNKTQAKEAYKDITGDANNGN